MFNEEDLQCLRTALKDASHDTTDMTDAKLAEAAQQIAKALVSAGRILSDLAARADALSEALKLRGISRNE